MSPMTPERKEWTRLRIALATSAFRVQESREKRDAVIRRAHAAGWSLREIAEATQLSHAGVKKIVERPYQEEGKK